MSSRLTFLAQGRTRRLYRNSAHGPFYVRFKYGGVDYPRCTGTTDENAAKIKAKRIIDLVYAGQDPDAPAEQREQALADSRRLKLRSDYSPLGPVVEIYRARFGKDQRTKRTANGNIGALEKILRASGLTLEARANVLTGELIRNFEAEEEKRILRDGHGHVVQESELRVRTSLCSYVKQARSIFKRSIMSWYEELELPDLKGFREQGTQQPERPRPRPLDQAAIAGINASAPQLAQTDPPCYVAHLLFSRLGMRNTEIKAARRSWITRSRDAQGREVGKLGVIYRPEEGFKPKKKTERWIPIGPTTLAAIDRHFAPSPDGDFLIPAKHKTERDHIVDDRHGAWAGQFIKGYSKVSYELRRYAGSLVYAKTGKIEYVQQFLGHADLKTTTEWYWYLIGEVPALDAEDFAPAPLSVVREVA